MISCEGEGIANHAGMLALLELADGLGLTAALDSRPSSLRQRRSAHAPGQVLVDVAVMLAAGGSCLSDLGALAGQERFGPVASIATAWRTIVVAHDRECRRRSAPRDRRLKELR